MWHSDHCGLDPDDETSNFNKTRSFALSDSSVFESHTLATIRKAPENNLTSAPNILSQFIPNVGLTVVVDQTLIIYEESFQTTILTWRGEENITCFLADPSGQFLFLGLGNVCMCCIHIATGISVFERELPNDRGTDKILKIQHENNGSSVLVFTSGGHIYRFNNIALALFAEICKESEINENALDTISEQIEVHALFSKRGEESVSCTALLTDEGKVILANNSVDILCFTPNDSIQQLDTFLLEDVNIARVLKMEPIDDLEIILCLTHAGQLAILCQQTWTVMHMCELERVKDFTIVSDVNQDFCVLVSTAAPEILLMNLPGFNTTWRLNDNQEATYTVIRNEILLDDGIIYIECQMPADQVFIKAMTKSRLEDRLERMLRRGKFEAAYEFARLLHLDFEIIHKARIHKIMSDLQTITWSRNQDQDAEKVQTLFSTLLESLDGISDTEFVTLCCVKTLAPDLKMIQTLLLYAKKRLSSVDVKSATSGLQQGIVELNTSLARLYTYQSIRVKQGSDVESWLKFSKANLLDEVMEYLRKDNIDVVIILWVRHRTEIIDILARTKPQLLDLINKEADCSVLIQLLEVITGDLLNCCEQHLKYLVAWIFKKNRSLELKAGVNWCEASLKFCQSVLSIIEAALESSSGLCSVQVYSPNSPMQSLVSLIDVLQSLTLLKNSFNIRMSFAEYGQVPKEVVFDILDRTASAQIPHLFTSFLNQYMFENIKISSDAVLTEYIKLLLESSVNWWHTEEAVWEDKISVLLPLVVNAEKRVQFIICVLRRAPVPWSSCVLSLAQCGRAALKAPHQLITAVQTEFNLVPGKLILKKYGFKQDLPPKQHLSRLIRFIYAQKKPVCSTVQLQDAVVLVKSLDSNKNYDPYEFFVCNLLKQGKMDEAMNFLDNPSLEPAIVKACCKVIIENTHLLIKSQNKMAENFVSTLQSVKQRLKNINSKGKNKQVKGLDSRVEKMKHVFLLYQDLNTASSVSELSNPEKQENTLRIVLNKLHDSGVLPSEVILKKIATSCGLTYEETLMSLFQITSHEHYGKLAQSLLNADSINCEYIAAKLLGVTSYLLCYYNPKKQPQFRDGLLPYVCQLTQIMLTYIHPCLLIKATELHQWVQLFKKQNLETSISEVTVHDFIITLLNFYRYFLSNRGCDTSLYVSEASFISEADQAKLCVNIALQRLKTEQPHDLVNLRVLTRFSSALSTVVSSDSLFPDIPDLIRLCIQRLMKKVFSARSLDTKLGVTLLSNFSQSEALATLHEAEKKYEADMLPLLHVSCLGMEYTAAHGLVSTYIHFQKLNVKCVWGNRISEFGISYQDAFRDSPEDRNKLVQRLSSDPNMKVSMLLDFCQDIQVNTQECLGYFLAQSLLSWEPVIQVKSDLDGKKQLVILNDVQHVRAVCEEIVCLVKDVKQLQDVLLKTKEKLNWYNYEIYQIVFDLLQSLVARTKSSPNSHMYKMVHVLVFLSSYMRVSPPQEYERTQWNRWYKDCDNLPDIAAYRLPFPMSREINFLNIITPELNMCNYPIWYGIVDHLGLEKNNLCALAIKRMAQDELRQPSTQEEWSLHPTYTTLLDSVRDCVDKISCPKLDELRQPSTQEEWSLHPTYTTLLDSVRDCVDKISCPKLVTASLYYLVNHLPPGADQVNAIDFCYSRAREWYQNEKSENSRTRLLQVQKKYLSVCTSHNLYRAGLGKKEFLKWVLNPETLITTLYNDKSVLLFHKTPRSRLPDINAITARIAEIHGIDIIKVRQELLSEWLSNKNQMLDASLTDVTTVQTPVPVNTCQDNNFLRACYILQQDNQFSSFLVSRAFPETDSQPTSVRLRALQCLFAVETYENLVQVTGRGDLKYYLEDLQFVLELENHGFFYTMEEFQSWTKADLIKYLLSKSNPHCIRLAFKLMAHYQVKEAALVNEILAQMMSFNMVDELVTFLPKIFDMNHQLSESQTSEMWNSIVDTLLSNCHPNMEKFETEFERTLRTILSCPQVQYLNMSNIEQHLTRLNKTQALSRIQSLAGDV